MQILQLFHERTTYKEVGLISLRKYAKVKTMKKDIHPTYYPKARVSCACGNTFTVGSTLESIAVEVCSSCHPFYTGKEKLMDKVGQVQKFRKRLSAKK